MRDDFDEDDDLREADALLRKADALLSRGKGAQTLRIDDDDLPLVTEIVPADALPAGVVEPEPDTEMTEQLIDLDTAIQREIETWLAAELPEVIGREVELLRERIRSELTARLRVTLLPRLSDMVATRLPAAGKRLRRR